MNLTLQRLANTELSQLQLPEDPLLPKLEQISQETWLALDGQSLQACVSLFTEGVPNHQGQAATALGNFYAQNPDAGTQILQHASQILAEAGHHFTLAPMNANTWHSYRLVTENSEHPPFFLEPNTPAFWQESFQAAGFQAVSHYSSKRCPAQAEFSRSAKKFARKQEKLQLDIQPIQTENFQQELREMHTLINQSFANNFYFTPIGLEEFLALYQPLLPLIKPEFTLMARDQGRLVGFLFALPDLLQVQCQQPVDSLIFKTLAKLPERRYAGLGNYLVALMHAKAHAHGLRHCIHALIQESNSANSIHAEKTETIRRYALFGKTLKKEPQASPKGA